LAVLRCCINESVDTRFSEATRSLFAVNVFIRTSSAIYLFIIYNKLYVWVNDCNCYHLARALFVLKCTFLFVTITCLFTIVLKQCSYILIC